MVCVCVCVLFELGKVGQNWLNQICLILFFILFHMTLEGIIKTNDGKRQEKIFCLLMGNHFLTIQNCQAIKHTIIRWSQIPTQLLFATILQKRIIHE